MQTKAAATDWNGRFREVIADPLNLLIRRHPDAGIVRGDHVVLHNGNLSFLSGPHAYYGQMAQLLVLNRGVHEPLEELAFQEMLPTLPEVPVMLELGAYWAHYSMWLARVRPAARLFMVEPDERHAAAGRAHLALNGIEGDYAEDAVGPGRVEIDRWMDQRGLGSIDVLHADIQGYEAFMMGTAGRALADHRVGYWFVSTHSQALHQAVAKALSDAGYRIEVSADFDRQTTSFDGVIVAAAPDRPVLLPGPPPLGREEIASATPRALVQSLLPRLGPANRADGTW